MSGSLRRRLVIPVAALSAGGIAVMAVALYVVTRHGALRQHDLALASRARALGAIAEREDDGYEMELPPQPAGEPAAYVEVWMPDGAPLLRSPNLAGADLPREFATSSGPTFRDVVLPDGRHGRAVALRFAPRDDPAPAPRPLLLVLAEGTDPIDAELGTLRRIFLLVGGVFVVGMAGATGLLISRSTRPLARLAAEISRIDHSQLAARLPHEGLSTELEGFVHKLNELLARLEISFARERQFTADVSHELRTPLAGLRTLLEVTARGERSSDGYRAVITDALAAVKQLGTMTENMLSLARIDTGEVAIANEPVALHQLVDECWTLHAGIAAQRGVEFRNLVAADAGVSTDREKLRIVVTNLLSNAAEYTEAGGWIKVTHGPDLLAVTDSGPPIPPEHLERVFDRLWRGDGARSGDGAHCGIGLALSRSLCERLGLSLRAVSAADGRVTFRIARLAP